MIIYNPFSGKQYNVRQKIKNALDAKSILYQFYDTTGYKAAYYKAKHFDISNYSAVVAVGGDGTIHEVINGIMRREDKKKIPIALIPNGSGNDTCGGLEIDTLEESLIYL